METKAIPPSLAEIARGRDHLSTAEVARALLKAPGTLRRMHSQCGHVYGLRPVKVGSSLRFAVQDVAALLAPGTGGRK